MLPSFVRPTVAAMQGYVPGEQPRAGQRIIKLNTNENPFPPSPRVMRAIRSLAPEWLRRYPNPTADAFRKAAARLHRVRPDMIITGNGSDDILAMAVQAFLGPDDVLACPDPTYSLYPVLAQISQARLVTTPWAPGYDLPVDALLATRARAIFVANPNAPTGTFVAPSRFAALARRFDGAILIDEAYVDFADDNCVRLAGRHPNIVIARTLSKAYSLAGLRFGYAIAQKPVIEQLMKVRDSYPCDAISIAAATAAITDQAYARRTWRHVRAERSRLAAELGAMDFDPLPSQTNFILARVPGGDGGRLYRRLKQRGILVRYFDKPGLSDKVRITIGTTAQNNALLKAIRQFA